jgi:ATP-dependent Clp endopeptidase proteolytic subunit ClpP
VRIQRDNIDKWFDYHVLLDTRTVLLADAESGEVDGLMANYFLKAMHLLEQKPEQINVMLRSVGGCSYAGMAIYDCIKASHCHVVTTVYGHAFSMSAVILQAADERVMQPNALLMIHDGSLAINDSMRNVEKWVAIEKRQRLQMYDIFAARSGKSRRYWERKCEADYIMTAPEALAEGLIDKIAGDQ